MGARTFAILSGTFEGIRLSSIASFMAGRGLTTTGAKVVKLRANLCLGGDVAVPRMGGEMFGMGADVVAARGRFYERRG